MDDAHAQAPTAVQTGDPQAPVGVSAHFVNNVLAAAASYIDEDPDQARDVLAELGQFLAYGLRPASTPVTLAQELEHTATYLRLQQARFPGRIEASLASSARESVSAEPLTAGAVRCRVAGALEQRLRTIPGPVVIDLRAAGAAFELELRGPDDLVGDAFAIPLSPIQEVAT